MNAKPAHTDERIQNQIAPSPLPEDVERAAAPLPVDVELAAAPLPVDVELAAAYAWQCRAAETVLFQGRARLITAAGPVDLEEGVWLLARWQGLALDDTPDGELICVLPETP